MIEYSRRNALTLSAGLVGAMMTRATQAQSPAPMLKRPIPHSDETLPVVGLGTANGFGGGDRAETRKVFEALVTGGGTLIDTASTYGPAEAAIGEGVEAAKLQGKVFLATKMEGESAAEGRAEFVQSLNRLRVSKVDLMFLHNVRKPNQSLAYLRDWKAQGLCHVGVTSTFPRDFAAMEAVIKREKPDFVEVNYSL